MRRGQVHLDQTGDGQIGEKDETGKGETGQRQREVE